MNLDDWSLLSPHAPHPSLQQSPTQPHHPQPWPYSHPRILPSQPHQQPLPGQPYPCQPGTPPQQQSVYPNHQHQQSAHPYQSCRNPAPICQQQSLRHIYHQQQIQDQPSINQPDFRHQKQSGTPIFTSQQLPRGQNNHPNGPQPYPEPLQSVSSQQQTGSSNQQQQQSAHPHHPDKSSRNPTPIYQPQNPSQPFHQQQAQCQPSMNVQLLHHQQQRGSPNSNDAQTRKREKQTVSDLPTWPFSTTVSTTVVSTTISKPMLQVQQFPQQQFPPHRFQPQQPPLQHVPLQQVALQRVPLQQVPHQQASLQQAPLQQAPTQRLQATPSYLDTPMYQQNHSHLPEGQPIRSRRTPYPQTVHYPPPQVTKTGTQQPQPEPRKGAKVPRYIPSPSPPTCSATHGTPSKPRDKTAPPTKTCCSCKRTAPEKQFSGRQWKLGTKRKCRNCVSAGMASNQKQENIAPSGGSSGMVDDSEDFVSSDDEMQDASNILEIETQDRAGVKALGFIRLLVVNGETHGTKFLFSRRNGVENQCVFVDRKSVTEERKARGANPLKSQTLTKKIKRMTNACNVLVPKDEYLQALSAMWKLEGVQTTKDLIGVSRVDKFSI